MTVRPSAEDTQEARELVRTLPMLDEEKVRTIATALARARAAGEEQALKGHIEWAAQDAGQLIQEAVSEAHLPRIGLDWLDVLEQRVARALAVRDKHADDLNARLSNLATRAQQAEARIAELRKAAEIGLRYARGALLDAPGHSCGAEGQCDNDCAAFAYNSDAIRTIERALLAGDPEQPR